MWKLFFGVLVLLLVVVGCSDELDETETQLYIERWVNNATGKMNLMERSLYPWPASSQCYANSTQYMHAIQRVHRDIIVNNDGAVGDYMKFNRGESGFGDQLKGSIHAVLCGAYANKAALLDWHVKPSDSSKSVLSHILSSIFPSASRNNNSNDGSDGSGVEVFDVMGMLFEPHHVMWNSTTAASNVQSVIADQFFPQSTYNSDYAYLKEYKPPCIADVYLTQDTQKSVPDGHNLYTPLLSVSELFGATGPPQYNSTFMSNFDKVHISGMGTGSEHSVEAFYPPIKTGAAHFTQFFSNLYLNQNAVSFGCPCSTGTLPDSDERDEHNEHSGAAGGDVSGGADHAHDLRLVRQGWKQVGAVQRCCMLRLMYSEMSLPLRRAYTQQLEYVAKNVVHLHTSLMPHETQRGESEAAAVGKEGHLGNLRSAKEEKGNAAEGEGSALNDGGTPCSGLTLSGCLKRMFNRKLDIHRPIIGAHLRLGDSSFRSWEGDKVSNSVKLKVSKFMKCVKKLAENNNFIDPILLLATDHVQLRANIVSAQRKGSSRIKHFGYQDEIVKSVILTPTTPAHLVFNDVPPQGIVELMAEILTLSAADAFVASKSSFSMMATDFGAFSAEKLAFCDFEHCLIQQQYCNPKFPFGPGCL